MVTQQHGRRRCNPTPLKGVMLIRPPLTVSTSGWLSVKIQSGLPAPTVKQATTNHQIMQSEI
jgi:hypothetical protein